MHAAVLVIDMLKDSLSPEHPDRNPITPRARAILPQINTLTAAARARGWPVVFACDSFLEDDFIFGGRMKPHAIRGTTGAELADKLTRAPDDTLLVKRRFSAFFATDLDQTLRARAVDTTIVCGITTNFCVLTTALDAICHDFRVIIVEDATTALSQEIHEQTLDGYRKSAIYPLLQVMTCDEILAS